METVETVETVETLETVEIVETVVMPVQFYTTLSPNSNSYLSQAKAVLHSSFIHRHFPKTETVGHL